MATSFEVVSVKPSNPRCPGMSVGEPLGRFWAHCVTVWGLIYNAYDVRSFRDHPPGLPGWADSDLFDVDAKTDEQTATAMLKLSREAVERQQQLMLQSLLADRFHLRVHYESKIEPVYELAAAKGGPKVTPWPAEQPPRGSSLGPGAIRVQGQPIAMLTMWLSQVAGRMVLDKTGLTGKYDIYLKWTPDDQQGTADAGPTLFTALQEQLGLKLQPAKAPISSLVIDRVEQPSGN